LIFFISADICTHMVAKPHTQCYDTCCQVGSAARGLKTVWDEWQLISQTCLMKPTPKVDNGSFNRGLWEMLIDVLLAF